MGHAFSVIYKNFSRSPWSQRFSPLFSTKSFAFYMEVTIHFELILYKVWGLGRSWFFLAYDGPIAAVPFIKKGSPSINYFVCVFNTKTRSYLFSLLRNSLALSLYCFSAIPSTLCFAHGRLSIFPPCLLLIFPSLYLYLLVLHVTSSAEFISTTFQFIPSNCPV